MTALTDLDPFVLHPHDPRQPPPRHAAPRRGDPGTAPGYGYAPVPQGHPPAAGAGGYPGQPIPDNRQRPGPHPPPGYQPPRRPTVFELALPDLRNKVVNRLLVMNGKHAGQAWQRRRRDPIGPHVITLLYAEPPTGDPPWCALHVAPRLFLASDQAGLALLLYEMSGIAKDLLRDGADPRTHLANWSDDMSAQAEYIGLGVSSLDTPSGTWAEVQNSGEQLVDELEIPGRCYARLIDGTVLLVDRYARDNFGKVAVETTRDCPLDSVTRELVRPWTYNRHLHDPDPDRDPALRDIVVWLTQLHTIIERGARASRS
jgi:hypothetical protein